MNTIPQLSLEEIRGLALQQREMEAGRQPFVLSGGDRFAFPLDVLQRLGLESGQVVGRVLLCEIIRTNILDLQKRREENA